MPKPEAKQEQETYAEIIAAIDRLETEPERHISIQIDTSLRDAIQAARSSGKTTGVTIAIKVKPEHERRVYFSATVAAKLPRPPVSAVTLFADDEGHLHTSDPNQRRLEFPKPIPLTNNKES